MTNWKNRILLPLLAFVVVFAVTLAGPASAERRSWAQRTIIRTPLTSTSNPNSLLNSAWSVASAFMG